MEIIAIVEGVDATTGGNVQARHSYVCDEIQWNKTFEPCVFLDPDDGCPTVDFCLFHDLKDTDSDAAYAGEISSIL